MKIYALLIAVSRYPEGINDLPGCAEDLRAVRDFFAGYAKLNGVDFEPVILLNEEATKAGVIDAFGHFDQAGPEDVCFIYYSGHGAQMPAPPEFHDIETDKKCETMVLFDSRMRGGFDLADKELSYLIATHTAKAGQVLVIADSCHSGTVTREAAALPRLTVENHTPVTIKDFHGWRDYERKGAYYHPPVGAHVSLSACRPEQLAMEMKMGGTPHGIFTWFLLETMGRLDLAGCSYIELIDQVRVRVRNHYKGQDVHAAAGGGASLQQRFFGGKLERSRAYVLEYTTAGGWYVNQGEMAGTATGDLGRVLDGEEEREITVSRTEAGRAFVHAETWMDRAKAPYPVIGLETGGEPLVIYLNQARLGPVIGGNLRTVIDRQANLLLTDEPDAARYHLTLLEDYGVSLVMPGGDRPLFESVPRKKDGWVDEFVDKLARVANYERVLRLAPKERPLDLDQAVDIRLERVYLDDDNTPVPPAREGANDLPLDGTAVVSYADNDFGILYPPQLRMRIRLREGRDPVYVGLLVLDESFGVTGSLLEVKKLIPQDREAVTLFPEEGSDGRFYRNYFTLTFPATLHGWGLTECTNYFKVVVSESEFDLAAYEQEGLAAQEKLDPEEDNMRGVAGAPSRRRARRDRWNVKNIPVTIHSPLPNDAELTDADGNVMNRPVSVSAKPAGLTIGGIVLDASAGNARAMGRNTPPPCPTLGFGMEPMSLVTSRSAAAAGSPLDMVRLTGVTNGDAVTEASPLRLRAAGAGHEGCLVLGFDEESGRYFPVGFPDRETGEVVMFQLPEVERRPEEYSRSLGGSIKLFFRKVISDYLPWQDGSGINRLRMVDVPENAAAVTYASESAGLIREKVAAVTGPIVLFVHGIIGDTSTAPMLLRYAKTAAGQPVLDNYSLVLTYDYENLKTPLMDTAQDLQKRLADVGLGAGHGKTLHVYAHSMGGLVSRCFIEILQGKEVVSHLVQFGTPNGGSPYGNAAQLMTPLLSRALAGGAAYNPWLTPLLGLRWFLNNALLTLQQMRIGSDFLKMLEDKGSRGEVPYTLVNGDIRKIADVDAPAEAAFLQRIMARFDWRDGADLVFFQSPTDVAVSVKSQQQVPGITGLAETVGCDHLSYFADPAGIAGYEGYLGRLFPEG